MQRTLNLIELNVPILEQLHLEERLLRTQEDFFCIFNYKSPSAYVLPLSAKKEEWLQKEASPVIRRYTGGGAVVIDENTLFVSFIGPNDLLNEAPTPSSLHRFAEPFYQATIPAFQRRENDYCINDRKVGGNAQYITKHRFVHHTSLLWDYNLESMKGLKFPPRTPQHRKNRSHEDFIISLKEHFETPSFFFSLLRKHLETNYIINNSKINNKLTSNCRISSFIEN